MSLNNFYQTVSSVANDRTVQIDFRKRVLPLVLSHGGVVENPVLGRRFARMDGECLQDLSFAGITSRAVAGRSPGRRRTSRQLLLILSPRGTSP